MRFTVLNENTAGKRGFLAEHGLSVLIAHQGRKLLFDTGQTDIFLHNAKKIGETLADLDAIILSHGHFDHCGGLEYLAKQRKLPPVYVRKTAFLNKQAINDDKKTYRMIGIPWKQELLRETEVLTEDKQEIFPGVWVLGNVPYTVPFEKKPGIFFIDSDGKKQPDNMEDEQLLVIETEKGLCIFAGCCHAGIINCLSYVKKSFPDRPVYSVLAGMHLSAAGDERIDQTVEALKRMDISVLMPVHCTGIYGIGKMKAAFGDTCRILETGAAVEL